MRLYELGAQPAAFFHKIHFYLKYYNYSNLGIWQAFSQKEQSEPVNSGKISDSICC